MPRGRSPFVVLPPALAGITTGVLPAIPRVMGETAPLLCHRLRDHGDQQQSVQRPPDGIAAVHLDQAGRPNDTAIARAWAAAPTLIIIIMLLNPLARFIAWWRRPAAR
jgi:phosphate transport system permease protein